LLRHAFVEVPAVSVVKIEMLEKCFSTQQWVHGYVFIRINYTIKFIFKADSINLASVEEVPILFVDGLLSWDSPTSL
jgi:hypothetical protein